jgi:hypothetical protein
MPSINKLKQKTTTRYLLTYQKSVSNTYRQKNIRNDRPFLVQDTDTPNNSPVSELR